ncbi:hypothetical protein TWF730_003232 [Orbilia blumenaviensis]|uniref:Rhodopsin domain-containing protein n=1 Tax=Orbilia blumenaviensis TaxID=1796055 RepID=A0AAV9U4R2_9PEZI
MFTLTLSLMNIGRHGFDNLPGAGLSVTSGLDLNPKDLHFWKTYGILGWVGEICNITTQYLVKGCLLLVYHSLTRNRKTNIVNKVVAGIVAIGYFLIIILFLAAWCHPLKAYWTPSLMSEGHRRACYTFIPHHITVLVVNTVTDVLVFAVPIPMIWKVKVSHLRRFFIIAIFGIGFFSIVACICARSALLIWQHYNNVNEKNINRNYVVWMAREVSSAVIVGNLYYYAPLIKMTETWVSRLRTKRALYCQPKSPDIEQTPPSERDVEFPCEISEIKQALDAGSQSNHAGKESTREDDHGPASVDTQPIDIR